MFRKGVELGDFLFGISRGVEEGGWAVRVFAGFGFAFLVLRGFGLFLSVLFALTAWVFLIGVVFVGVGTSFLTGSEISHAHAVNSRVYLSFSVLGG